MIEIEKNTLFRIKGLKQEYKTVKIHLMNLKTPPKTFS